MPRQLCRMHNSDDMYVTYCHSEEAFRPTKNLVGKIAAEE
jgi:hypothetical protein